jgi:hypothetical protein
MKDLTVLYYTANLVEEPFASNVRKHLLSVIGNTTIISISHKPIDFGENICVAGFEISIYNIYKQILIGAKQAKTKYVMCAEDDALYNEQHIQYRPVDAFAYNNNRWMVTSDIFFHRNRIVMSMCIAPTDLMIKTLEDRFSKFPKVMTPEEMGAAGGFGEPGRLEGRMGLPPVKMEIFSTVTPTLVFNHRPSVGGVRKITSRDVVQEQLPFWGRASDLWDTFYTKEA